MVNVECAVCPLRRWAAIPEDASLIVIDPFARPEQQDVVEV
jgi:hypothetical protein